MIGAETRPAPQAFAASLADKARALGQARAGALALGRSPSRWRKARLLWPLFARSVAAATDRKRERASAG